MNLNDFIARASGVFDKFEAWLKNEPEQAKELAALKASVAERDTTIASLTAETTDLRAKLETALADAAAKSREATNLTEALEAETKRAETTLASMGVDSAGIPASPNESNKPAASNILAEFESIVAEHDRAAFWQKNKAAIQAARRMVR